MIAIVEAVPIVLHAPSPAPRHVSSPAQSASDTRPARRSSYIRHRAVPLPSRSPRKLATGRYPPVTIRAGMSALASAIR